VFTVEERDRARDLLLELARADDRIAAGAEIGALTRGDGDRWSDLDLTFGVASGASVHEVLADWTRDLARDLRAAHLFDLPVATTIYRVFLLPGNLQVDLSFTPESDFGALGPAFRLLFGSAVERSHPAPPSARHLFGVGAHHAVRARICIERGRRWQAEYWISGVRDQALALACLRRGLAPSHGRGFDGLPAETLELADAALVRALDREELLRALAGAVAVLLHESGNARELARTVESQLRELTATALPS
jgi:hypothetical protein